jgi:hypothetical protein
MGDDDRDGDLVEELRHSKTMLIKRVSKANKKLSVFVFGCGECVPEF